MCERVRRGRVRAPSVPWLIASSNLEQVWDTAAALNRTAEPSLQSLERQLAARPEPLRAVQRLQGLLQTLLGYTAAIPFWRNPAVSLEALAEQVDLYDWYRCVPLSCLPPLVPAPLSGSVRFQLPVPEVLLGEGLGSLVVTGRSPPLGHLLQGQRPISVPRMPVDAPLGPGLFAQLCPAPPAPTLGLAPCPAQVCCVPAGGWAIWACCCSTWPSASWCWSASSAAPRGSW